MNPDMVTGLFEFAAMWFVLLSIRRLHKDKLVRGVSWVHVGFYTVWGLWNLYYYPHLEQWWALAGGVGIVCTNTLWLGQLVYYSYEERRRGGNEGAQ